ncbi:MAG: OB-fold nucleic acid binding domain-containing protein [Mycobacteriales bacterium]|nr:OB-fold nucleic acid binding domain-containing protein [Frankia sp.]
MTEGKFRRALRRMTADVDELVAEELKDKAKAAGATSVADCHVRRRARVLGTVQSITVRPRAGVPALEADLYDGTSTLLLVWLGRRRIEGIRPGVHIAVDGMVGVQNGRKTMFNPSYQLLARAVES